MKRASRPWILAAVTLSALAAPIAAHAQDASLTVYLRASAISGGAFNKTGTTGTQVHVFARSSRSAMYNSSAVIYAPTAGTAPAGTSFVVQIPNLYSNARYSHTYTIELDWPDTTKQTLTTSPTPIAPGANSYGLGGLGSTTPLDVRNQLPPVVTALNCYPDLPDKSTQIYISWSSGSRPGDYSRTELHLSTTSGFTPSAATLVRMPPWGTTSQKLTGLVPQTAYYYCVRTVDEYGASSDACSTAACTTAAPTSGGSDGGSGPVDAGGGPVDAGSDDGGSAPGDDGGSAPAEDGGGPSDSDGGTPSDPDVPSIPPTGSVPVGCGCSLVPTSTAPGWLALGPALLVLARRRRRAGG